MLRIKKFLCKNAKEQWKFVLERSLLSKWLALVVFVGLGTYISSSGMPVLLLVCLLLTYLDHLLVNLEHTYLLQTKMRRNNFIGLF